MKKTTGFWIVLWVVLVFVTGFFAFGHGYGVNFPGQAAGQVVNF